MFLRALKNWPDDRFYDFCQIFRNYTGKFSSYTLKSRSISYGFAANHPFKRLLFRHSARISIFGRTSPPYAVATLMIFSPRVILNAACRYQQSTLFLAIVVNLACLAPSCKWLIPKYCSTIYRTLDIFLFRSFSYSVNLAVVVSFLMMPSSILFWAKKSLFGSPKYPLSAYTFLMDCFV